MSCDQNSTTFPSGVGDVDRASGAGLDRAFELAAALPDAVDQPSISGPGTRKAKCT
jgi:hypothetical protein